MYCTSTLQQDKFMQWESCGEGALELVYPGLGVIFCCSLQVGSYTNFFADALVAEAERDKRIVGIHAAMGGGTGMNRFEKRFPDRTFDVGIAEQVCMSIA